MFALLFGVVGVLLSWLGAAIVWLGGWILWIAVVCGVWIDWLVRIIAFGYFANKIRRGE